MLPQDVIEPSNSEWNFPLILVPKPDGTMRPVTDYRELNKEKKIPDRLPPPIISDVLSLGTSNKLFSTIDIKFAFRQIELDEALRPLTAFSTPTGHYQFRRMPFGLSNGPLFFFLFLFDISGNSSRAEKKARYSLLLLQNKEKRVSKRGPNSRGEMS